MPGRLDPERRDILQRVRSRQVTVNKRFKTWGILSQSFCSAIYLHGDAFWAVAVINQLSLEQDQAFLEIHEC